MRTTDRTRLLGLMMAGAMFATSAHSQTQPAPAAAAPVAAAAPAAPAPDTDTVEEVTVRGQSTKSQISAAQNVLKVDAVKSSSCNFSVTADNYIEDYIAATTRTKTKSRTGNTAPEVADPLAPDVTGAEALSVTAETPSQSTYFSQNAPSGATAANDAAPPNLFTSLDATGQTDACGTLDRNFVAGRAEIVRRDKDLPAGYAFFEKKQYAEALAAFTRVYKKLTLTEGGKEAALMIGKIHLAGVKGKPDVPEAVVWLSRAANAPFNPSVVAKDTPAFDPQFPSESLTTISEASLALARIYLMGEGMPKDAKAARKWYERANYVGFVPAAKTLGDMYFYGFDMDRDVKRAVEFYNKAATLGYAPAAYSLAEIYYYGEPGVEPNLPKAMALYQTAARVKHPGALYALAVAYDSGDGMTADPQKALAFYRDAAVAGNIDAQSAMGTYFYEGSGGVAKDDVAARRWFEAAAGEGQKEAMFNLAVMQMKGEGGPKDLVKSYVWFSLTKAKGNPNATAALAAVEKQMSAAEKSAAAEIISPKKAG